MLPRLKNVHPGRGSLGLCGLGFESASQASCGFYFGCRERVELTAFLPFFAMDLLFGMQIPADVEAVATRGGGGAGMLLFSFHCFSV